MDGEIRPFSLPLAEPLVTAGGRIESREGFLVRLTGDGYRGIGEAAPLPGWTESLGACRSALEDSLDRLGDTGPEAALEGLDGTPAARHGLALALADHGARRTERPLYRVFGTGRRVDSVPVNAVIGDGSTEATVREATAAAEAGFECLKLKVGARDVGADQERLGAVERAVGRTVGLRADANGAWGRSAAADAVSRLAGVGIDYLEQPLPADDLDGLTALRDGPVEIAVDESLTRHPPEVVLNRGAADRLILKPMVLGGPDRALDAAALAREQGLPATVTTTVDAVVARTAAVHLAAAVDALTPAGLATAGRFAKDLAPDPAPVEDGRIDVPQSAGIGVEIEGWAT